MTTTLAASQSVILMSIIKPLIMAIIIVAWAYMAEFFDKDAEATYQPRRIFNGVQMGAAALALLVWLLIPIFWIGLPVAILIMLGGAGAYVYVRNQKVSDSQKWEFTTKVITDKLEQRQADAAMRSANLRLINSKGEMTDVLTSKDPIYPAYQLLEQTLDFSLPRHASRIDMIVSKEKMALAVQIDGVSYAQPKPEPGIAMQMIDYLKSLAGLNLDDRRSKQTGQFVAHAGDEGEFDLRITTSASTRSSNLKIEINPGQRIKPNIKEIGLLDSQAKQLKPLFTGNPTGVVLITSPPHHGRKTSMYSIVQEHDPYTLGVVTLEDNILQDLEGVHHNKIESGSTPDDIANRVAVMIRRDPNIFMLSEFFSPKVPGMIAEVGEEMRFYVATEHEDTFSALKDWIKLVGNKRTAAKGLSAIVSQKLIRKLCVTCRLAYKPDPALIKKLNLSSKDVAQLYKKSGQVIVKNKPVQCPTCHGLGFMGRTAVFEVMMIDDQARNLIRSDDYDTLRSYLRKNKMMWMQEAALAKAAQGVTAISEVTRVMSKTK